MNHHSNRLPPEDESGGRKKKSRQSLSADQLGHLVSRSMEGEITEAETELLQHHLKTDESAQDFFVEYASVHAMLTCHFQPLDLLETTGSKIRLVHREKKRKNKKKNWNVLEYWQIALIAGATMASVLVVVIGWSLLFSKPVPVSPEIAQVPSKTAQTFQPANTDWKGKRQALTTGTLELHFPTGAKALVTAPATFIVTGDTSVRLLTGKLVANVPASGIGFTVDTPRGRVVDLGTTFSVHATKELNTVVQVFRGKVIASLVDNKGVVQTSRQIEENHAVNIDFLKKGLLDIPYASNNFFANIQKEYGIASHSKNVVFQEKMPKSLAEGKREIFRDDLVIMYPEKKNVLLQEDLSVQFDKPGSYRFSKDLPEERGMIPANATVDCFRICYAPKITTGKTERTKTAYGKIHFDRPVLGLINLSQNLGETDKLFHPDWKKLSNLKLFHSAIEVKGIDKEITSDEIMLSEDRKTLTFKLHAPTQKVNVSDEFRVLLQAKE